MAAPTTSTRSTPAGVKPGTGFATKFSFQADPDVSFWEKNVTPPGIDGGDMIDTTTMFNVTYRTGAARTLIKITEIKARVTYDPMVWSQIIALCNVEGSGTFHYPNGDKLDLFCYLRSATKAENTQEENQPEADIVINVTNWDPTNNVEQGPVFTAAAGTGT